MLRSKFFLVIVLISSLSFSLVTLKTFAFWCAFDYPPNQELCTYLRPSIDTTHTLAIYCCGADSLYSLPGYCWSVWQMGGRSVPKFFSDNSMGKYVLTSDVVVDTVGLPYYPIQHPTLDPGDTLCTGGGENWLPIRPLALAGPDYYAYYRPSIVVKDSSVFVAFAKNVDSDPMVRFKKSTDCGETWSQEIHISHRAICGHWAKMVLNTAGLYITYEDGLKIWCNKSTDWGDSWSDDIFISDMDSSTAQWPSIGADDNGGVYITWFDYKYSPYGWTGDIFLRRSTDNGQTWDSIMILTNNHLCIESDVCADKSSVHVVWHDERHGGGNTEIYHRRSTDSGFSWQEEDRLTDAPYGSVDPWLAFDKSKLHITWIDDRDYPEDGHVYFKKGYRYIPGDPNSDTIVNVADIVFLINYLFIGGPSPNIFETGDVNSDAIINVADVVYLINFLFKGGPSPQGC